VVCCTAYRPLYGPFKGEPHPIHAVHMPIQNCPSCTKFVSLHGACSCWTTCLHDVEHSSVSTVHTALCPSQALSYMQPLDIVPVDVAINSILAAVAASAGRPGTHVYQIGTSQCNPLRETLQSYAAIFLVALDDITAIAAAASASAAGHGERLVSALEGVPLELSGWNFAETAACPTHLHVPAAAA